MKALQCSQARLLPVPNTVPSPYFPCGRHRGIYIVHGIYLLCTFVRPHVPRRPASCETPAALSEQRRATAHGRQLEPHHARSGGPGSVVPKAMNRRVPMQQQLSPLMAPSTAGEALGIISEHQKPMSPATRSALPIRAANHIIPHQNDCTLKPARCSMPENDSRVKANLPLQRQRNSTVPHYLR
jgi:hypothetical protein